jgi:hypothetical protein
LHIFAIILVQLSSFEESDCNAIVPCRGLHRRTATEKAASKPDRLHAGSKAGHRGFYASFADLLQETPA